MEAGACGKVWARGSWLEDKEGKWGIWSRGLEGDLEGICLVMGKYGVLKWEKALKSYSGLSLVWVYSAVPKILTSLCYGCS